MPAAASAGASSATSGSPVPSVAMAPAPSTTTLAISQRRQQRRRGQQRPGQAGRAQQPPRPPAPAGPAHGATPARPPRSTPGPGRRRVAPRPSRSLISCVLPLAARRATQRRPQQPPRPVRAALHRAFGDASQLGHLGDGAVFHVHQPPHLTFRAAGRPERRRSRQPVRPWPARPRPGRPLQPGLGRRGRQRHGRRAPAAEHQRRLAPGDPPQPAAARRLAAGSRARRARPPGTSPAARPRRRARAAPRAAGRPATARAGRTAPAARRRRPAATRAISSSSSIASLLHLEPGRFTPEAYGSQARQRACGTWRCGPRRGERRSGVNANLQA